MRYVALPVDHVDTDQIIPARFLTTTRRDGLAEALFADRRGTPGFEILDTPAGAGATALVVGSNFGCGSSREHAVWALSQAGYSAVLGVSLADIFRHNALENGVLALEISPALHRELAGAEHGTVTVDLERCTVSGSTARESFAIEPFARYRMLREMDPLDFLMQANASIARFERRHDQDGD